MGTVALDLDSLMAELPADEDRGMPDGTVMGHVHLHVADIAAAEAFYAGALGLPVVERWPDREALWVMAGSRTRIGLWRPQVGLAGGRGGVHVHFAFQVPDDEVDRMGDRLGAAGVEFEGPIQLGPGRSIYVTDPDGNSVEFWSQDMSEYTAGARAGGEKGTFRSAKT
jgi:catechol-2,3-dioxygenase